jgi:hypothetical protein
MNKRIRRKQLAEYDQHLAEGIGLYARRPRGAGDEKWEALARSLLAMDVALALVGRLALLGGPRRGWQVDPPDASALQIRELRPDALQLQVDVVLRDAAGEAVMATERLHVVAHRDRRGWRATMLTLGQPAAAGAAG